LTSGRRGHYVDLSWSPTLEGRSDKERRPQRYRAFVPARVADYEPPLTSFAATLCERAATDVANLNTQPGDLVPLEGLGRQLIRSEALASSQIEGLQLSQRKLAEAEIPGRGDHKAREVVGAVHAMEQAMKIGAEPRPLTTKTITDLHREIAVDGPLDKIAGQIREEPSWIGGRNPPSAEFVGPPWEEVKPLLVDLCGFMNRDDLPVVAQAAIAHAQFETIHPFGDGNGRVGRCLIHVLFRRRGLATRYVPPISIVLGANKDTYIDGLRDFSDGGVDEWIRYFAEAVQIASFRAREFSTKVATLQSDWRRRIEPARSDSAALALIDLLPQYPVLTAAMAETETDRSRRATLTGLERLAEAKVVTRHRNQKKGDSWEAKELFRLLDEFEDATRMLGS
jgi:Fic family protein